MLSHSAVQRLQSQPEALPDTLTKLLAQKKDPLDEVIDCKEDTLGVWRLSSKSLESLWTLEVRLKELLANSTEKDDVDQVPEKAIALKEGSSKLQPLTGFSQRSVSDPEDIRILLENDDKMTPMSPKYRDGGDQAFKFFCQFCSFKTHRQSHFRRHQARHLVCKSALSCDQCDFRCLRASDLGRHALSHAPEPFRCSVDQKCSFVTASKAQLSKHERYRHKSERTALECQSCAFRTLRRGLATAHAKQCHSGGTKSEKIPKLVLMSKCPQCPYTSRKAANLKRHVSTVHTQERSYLCSVCGIAFKRRDTLKQHLEGHGQGVA